MIQFNINILNNNDSIPSLINKTLRYRDDITEGYSISPNFFIQGIIKDYSDFDSIHLNPIPEKPIEQNSHFEERLFDRDTLFVKYYEINFLFVLNAYSNFSEDKIKEIRNNFKVSSNQHFKKFFNEISGFNFYEFNFNSEQELKEFVDVEFRHITGRVIRTISNPSKLILAVNPSRENKLKDKSLLNRFIVTNNPITKQKEFVYNTNSPIKPAINDYEF